MGDAITPQLVGNYSSRFVAARSQQTLEKSLCCCSVSAALEKNIHDFAILVHCPPKIVLYPSDPHENLVEVIGIAVPLMPAPRAATLETRVNP